MLRWLHQSNSIRQPSCSALQHDAHQKNRARVAVRVKEYVSGLLRMVLLRKSCSNTAYATIGHAVKIMLNVLIIMVVKMGIAEKPACHKHSKQATQHVQQHSKRLANTWYCWSNVQQCRGRAALPASPLMSGSVLAC